MKTVLPDGRRVDAETGVLAERPPVSRAALGHVTALRLATSALGSLLTDDRNAAQRIRVGRLVADADRDAEALKQKLDHGWNWLERHPDDPRADAYHERWVGWLGDYEALCDAVATAREALT